jgi:hypothetical protein
VSSVTAPEIVFSLLLHGRPCLAAAGRIDLGLAFQVQFPDQWPKGWDPGNHFLVIDNGIGLTTAWDIDHLP